MKNTRLKQERDYVLYFLGFEKQDEKSCAKISWGGNNKQIGEAKNVEET